jgi:prevent-host-death family protein
MDDATVDTVGVRELRNQVAAVLRRAQNGDRVIVTVDGRPVAQLTPVQATGPVAMADLVAAGLVDPPGRADKPPAPDPALLPVDIRADHIVQEVRG